MAPSLAYPPVVWLSDISRMGCPDGGTCNTPAPTGPDTRLPDGAGSVIPSRR